MKVNLTKLLNNPVHVTFTNNRITDAAYLLIKDMTVRVEDSPHAFLIEKEERDGKRMD